MHKNSQSFQVKFYEREIVNFTASFSTSILMELLEVKVKNKVKDCKKNMPVNLY